MGASAYATAGRVVLSDRGRDLHTVAHEAAHVIQQRGGVALKGGVGEAGDAFERHADAVADKVVAGESAERLLDSMSGSGSSSGAVQLQPEAAPDDEMRECRRGGPKQEREAGPGRVKTQGDKVTLWNYAEGVSVPSPEHHSALERIVNQSQQKAADAVNDECDRSYAWTDFIHSVIGYASPEGSEVCNKDLSEERAHVAVNTMASIGSMPLEPYHVSGQGEQEGGEPEYPWLRRVEVTMTSVACAPEEVEVEPAPQVSICDPLVNPDQYKIWEDAFPAAINYMRDVENTKNMGLAVLTVIGMGRGPRFWHLWNAVLMALLEQDISLLTGAISNDAQMNQAQAALDYLAGPAAETVVDTMIAIVAKSYRAKGLNDCADMAKAVRPQLIRMLREKVRALRGELRSNAGIVTVKPDGREPQKPQEIERREVEEVPEQPDTGPPVPSDSSPLFSPLDKGQM